MDVSIKDFLFCALYAKYNVHEDNILVEHQPDLVITSGFVNLFQGKTLSTVIGMVPFLIDGPDEQPFWFSLAVGTIGGLAFSIVPLVVFLPMVMKVDKID